MSGRLIRRWEGRSSPDAIQVWLAGYRARVLPLMKQIDGCLGASVHVERAGNPRTVSVLTYWADEGALSAFAGPDPERAVMQDWVRELIPDCDDFATHYDEVLAEEFE